jgi:poly(3-hydroxybutyrate) depolymerase
MRTVGAVLLATLLVSGCGGSGSDQGGGTAPDGPDTRLSARPSSTGRACAAGEHELAVVRGRRALMRVAPGRSSGRHPFLLAMHGANSGGAAGGLWAFRSTWSLPGLVIVAPSAAGSTWTLGPTDIEFVDRALRVAFRRCAVDRRRVAVGGFSAGAGLALWLGLTNGDFFGSVIALSGGGSLPRARVGKPSIFVAHGTEDSVISITDGGDALARQLRSDGYAVAYRRFRSGHRVVPAIARSTVRRALY